jgi:hypothetical protein
MASTGLSKTFSTNGTNNKKGTFSFWMKRTGLTEVNLGMSVAGAAGGTAGLYIAGNNKLYMYLAYNGSSWQGEFITNRLFRDTNAYYHIVLTWDTTQATSSDRLKLYVNGVQETSFQSISYPPQDNATTFGTATAHTINYWSNGAYFDGVMSHFHYTDGYSYDASAFGEYDANGVWKINTSPSVTYGTNGFFILKDGNSVTDQSGNGNNWTVAGGTLTNTEDNPSNVFCTYNPLATSSYGSLTHGNLRTIGINNAGLASTYGTISTTSSGKWYWEIKINNTTSGVYPYIGIGDVDNPNIGRLLNDSGGATGETNYSSPSFHYRVDGGVYIAGSLNATYSSFAIGDIISFAVDMDNGASYIAKNGTWQNSGDPTSGASKTGAITTWTASSISGFLPSATFYYGASGVGNSAEVDANFGNGYFGTTAVSSAGTNASGNGIFEYDVPTGYTALSTKGLNL